MSREPNTRDLKIAGIAGSNGRGMRTGTVKIGPGEGPIPGPVFVPDGQPHLAGRKKKARTFYRVAVRHNSEVPVSLKKVIGELEKQVIVDVLSEVNGNQKNAARILGIKYTTLNEKLKRYHIKVKRISVIE